VSIADIATGLDTEGLLRVVDLVDEIGGRAGNLEGLRRELLSLHGAAHRILNGEPSTAGPASPDEAAEMALNLADLLGDWIDRLIAAYDVLEAVAGRLAPPSSGPPISGRQSGIFGWTNHPLPLGHECVPGHPALRHFRCDPRLPGVG
jgi:hypothetical protein